MGWIRLQSPQHRRSALQSPQHQHFLDEWGAWIRPAFATASEAGVGSDCNLRIEQNVATCALKNFDAEANQSHDIEALFSCLAPSNPRVFRIVTYNGRSFNATWSVPKGTAFYNLTVVPKINPDFNETYSTTGSKECFIFMLNVCFELNFETISFLGKKYQTTYLLHKCFSTSV